MTEEATFIDSSAFLAFFVDGVNIFEKIGGKPVTSVNVVEEVAYILTKERGKDLTGIGKHYDLLDHLRKNPDLVSKISDEVISDLEDLIDYFNIAVLPPASYKAMFEVMKSHGLLPNDALIAATCRHYGIKKIATFDEDFKRVEFLEIVEVG